LLRTVSGSSGIVCARSQPGGRFTDAQVAAFFESLNPIMLAPLPDDSPWQQDGREGDVYRSAKAQAPSLRAHRGVDLPFDKDFADPEAAMRHAAHWLMASPEGAEFLRSSLAAGFSD
jgi:hypothetical protein